MTEEKNVKPKSFIDARLLETIIITGTICACGAAIIVALYAFGII